MGLLWYGLALLSLAHEDKELIKWFIYLSIIPKIIKPLSVKQPLQVSSLTAD